MESEPVPEGKRVVLQNVNVSLQLANDGVPQAIDVFVDGLRAALQYHFDVDLGSGLSNVSVNESVLIYVEAGETFKVQTALTVRRKSSLSILRARKRIVALAERRGLPAVYSDRQFVTDGGLMSYGTNFTDLYRRQALYVDRIPKGAKPAEMPVEQPTKSYSSISARRNGWALQSRKSFYTGR